jgi:predicted SAM-dependent methyltransferase
MWPLADGARRGINMGQQVNSLGDSVFNYKDYTEYRFIHYFQQIELVLKYNPKTILEIGPGDYTVTDFLRRKGFAVKTADNDEKLYPDYLVDIKNDININENFDLILASEVFEHAKFERLEGILNNVGKCLNDNGFIVFSVPYSTIRLFPERPDYGKTVSCEGRVYTAIPYHRIQLFLTILRGFYRLLIKKSEFKKACEYFRVPDQPDEDVNIHHWDAGFHPTTIKEIQNILLKYFNIIEQKIYINTNCVFFVIQSNKHN